MISLYPVYKIHRIPIPRRKKETKKREDILVVLTCQKRNVKPIRPSPTENRKISFEFYVVKDG